MIRPRLYQSNPQTMRTALDDVLGPIGVTRVAATVTGIDPSAHRVTLTTAGGEPASLGLRAAGARLRQPSGHTGVTRDRPGRLVVDAFLRVDAAPEVFVAGDTAAARCPDGHTVLQSCQHAIPLGKFAGHNAVADLLGLPLQEFDPGPYVTCLDLGQAGAVLTTGWDRQVT